MTDDGNGIEPAALVQRVLGPPKRTGLRQRDSERLQLGRQHAVHARHGERAHGLDALHIAVRAHGGGHGGKRDRFRVDGGAGHAGEEGDGILERKRRGDLRGGLGVLLRVDDEGPDASRALGGYGERVVVGRHAAEVGA
jgi:hypothetical protein